MRLLGHFHKVDHPAQECLTMLDNCCSMTDVANQGLQLTLCGHPLTAPRQHQCSCAKELVRGEAEFHGNGVDLDAKKCEKCGGAFSLMHGHWNTQAFADLKHSQESLLTFVDYWVGRWKENHPSNGAGPGCPPLPAPRPGCQQTPRIFSGLTSAQMEGWCL